MKSLGLSPSVLRLLAGLSALWPALALAGGIALRGAPDITGLLAPYLPAEATSPRQLERQFAEILATEGYFSPHFDFAEEAGGLRVGIEAGPRTRVTEVTLAVDGEIDPKRKAELRAGWRLPVGRPFRQADWNAAKQQVLAALLADEHAAARLLDSRADIDAAGHGARLYVRYDAGPRYRFGELRIEGLHRYTPDLVARYNRDVRPGDPYREARLNDLQAVLQATPYFSTVRVALDTADAVPAADGTARAPVVVSVRERPAHRIGFGVGASSNTGARVEATYQTPNLFSEAWNLDSGLRLEQKKQTVYADVFLPPDARNRRHGFGAVVEASDIQGLKTERHALGVQSIQQRGSVEQRLSLHWEEEKREPDGAASVRSRALVPNVMWTWRHVDNLLDPHRGIVLQAQIGGGARAALSDANFIRLHGRWQQYLPLGARDTLGLRAELGYTLADSRQHIPQDYLFRAGGTGSVRGYAYQSLGIKEGSAVVGGRYLGVVSAEATHWLNDSWGVAAFVDAGDAVDTLQRTKLAVGYGLGARWKSPAGPLGADLAYGERSRQVHLHFSLAIPF